MLFPYLQHTNNLSMYVIILLAMSGNLLIVVTYCVYLYNTLINFVVLFVISILRYKCKNLTVEQLVKARIDALLTVFLQKSF